MEPRGTRGRDLRGRVRVSHANGTDASVAEVCADASSRSLHGAPDVAGDEERPRNVRQRRRWGRRSPRRGRGGRGDVVDDWSEALRREIDDGERGVLHLSEEVPVHLHHRAVRAKLDASQLKSLDGVHVPLRLQGLHLVRSPRPVYPRDVEVHRGHLVGVRIRRGAWEWRLRAAALHLHLSAPRPAEIL